MFRQLLFESLGIVAGLPPTTGKGAYLQDAALGLAWTYPGATNLNILNFGGDPTGVAGVSGPIAAAIAALPVNGGTIYFPPGQYNVDALIRIQKPNVRLLGDGTPISTNFRAGTTFRGPFFCVGDSTSTPIPTTLGPALATGAGGSWLVNQNSLTNSRFDLMDSPAMCVLDGLTSFTFEFFVKMNSSGGVNVWDCSGNVDFDTGYTNIRSWQFSSSVSTRLDASVTFQSAGLKTINGLANLTVGTVYHVALCYNGTTLAYYIGGVQQGTVAVAADKLSVPWYSESYLGANSPTSFPGFTVVTDSLKDCYIDSLRVSNIAVYTSAFTPPTAKLGSFGSTLMLINFDNFSADNMVMTGLLGGGQAPSYFINRQATAGAVPGITFQNLQLDGGGALNPCANFNNTPQMYINNCNFINTIRGPLVSNGFFSNWDDIFVSTSQIQNNQAKWGLCFLSSGITTVRGCRISGGPVGFFVNDSSMDFETCSVSTNILSTHAFACEGDNAYAGISLTNFAIDAENSAPNLRYALAGATQGTGQNSIICTSCGFDTGLTTGRPPVFYAQGGPGADSLVFVGCRFYAEASTTQMIQLQSSSIPINIQMIGSMQPKQSTFIPWCSFPGFVNEWNLTRYSSTAGTPGSATINFPFGRFAIAAGTNSATITNNLVKSTSSIRVTKETLDATLTDFKVVPGAGSFVVTGNNNATGAVTFSFKV